MGPAQTVTIADAVAAAVLAVPAVASLHSGSFGEVATYLPGRRVIGVRVGNSLTEVHIVVAAGTPVLAVAEQVRAAVGPIVATPVDVYVEDIDPLPGDLGPADSPADGPANAPGALTAQPPSSNRVDL